MHIDGDAAAPLRRLTRQHFALYRGYLDGVADAQLHATYGDGSTDVRATRRLIAALRDTLSVLARRARDVEAAHLLRLRPGSIPLAELHGAPDVPTLEDFRDRVDPDGVFGESELLDLYRAEYPPDASPRVDRRIARNARLRRRQADALARMEASLAQEPRPDHPLDGWFEPAVAGRLASAGLVTLADLLELIEARRHRWYTAVPRLGPRGAQRVTDWLSLHAQALQHALSPLALVPRRQLPAGHPALTRARPAVSDGHPRIAPLEAFRPPAALDGEHGANRASGPNRIGAKTDLQAVEAWLSRPSNSVHTARAYRREAERLLLWSVVAKGRPISSLTKTDCAEYVERFLKNPQPAGMWVGRARAERFQHEWRPFLGALSDRSRETARAILSALGAWLVDVGYLASNPFAEIRRIAKPAALDASGRTLSHAQWRFLLSATPLADSTAAGNRDHVALLFAYATGLRRTELASATTGDLICAPEAEHAADAWELIVPGRRTAGRSVPIPRALMDAFRESLRLRGMPELRACPPGTPLLAHARTGETLSADGLGKIYKEIFARAAMRLESQSPAASRDLMRATTHWLRHTHSNHALDRGAELRDVRENLGHASQSTTALYVSDTARRRRAIDALLLGTDVESTN